MANQYKQNITFTFQNTNKAKKAPKNLSRWCFIWTVVFQSADPFESKRKKRFISFTLSLICADLTRSKKTADIYDEIICKQRWNDETMSQTQWVSLLFYSYHFLSRQASRYFKNLGHVNKSAAVQLKRYLLFIFRPRWILFRFLQHFDALTHWASHSVNQQFSKPKSWQT